MTRKGNSLREIDRKNSRFMLRDISDDLRINYIIGRINSWSDHMMARDDKGLRTNHIRSPI